MTEGFHYNDLQLLSLTFPVHATFLLETDLDFVMGLLDLFVCLFVVCYIFFLSGHLAI